MLKVKQKAFILFYYIPKIAPNFKAYIWNSALLNDKNVSFPWF